MSLKLDLESINFQTLSARIRGEKYKVEKGKLVTFNWKDKLKYVFLSEFRKKIQEDVNLAIQRVFTSLTYEPGKKEAYIKLFQRLAPLSRKVFVRSEIKTSQFFADLKISMIREQLGLGSPEENTPFWDIFAESQVADWLGIHAKRNFLGSSGSYITYDLSKRKVGLFKPVAESPHGPFNPHLSIRLRNHFVWLMPIDKNRCVKEEEGAKNEEFTSRLCELLNWKNVPQARKVSFQSRSFSRSQEKEEGSFQLFLNNTEDGYKRFNIPRWVPPALSDYWIPSDIGKTTSLISFESFKKFALLEFMICNIDTNFGNMLFKKGSQEVSAIDAWFSMPFRKPDNLLDTRGLHAWRKIAHAEQKINDIDDILLNKESILALVDKVYQENASLLKKELGDRLKTLEKFARKQKTYRALSLEWLSSP